MDTMSLAQRVVDEATVVVDNVAPDQLGNPTPCAEWTVRDVLDHISNGAVLFAEVGQQGSISDELMRRSQTVATTRMPGGPRAPWR